MKTSKQLADHYKWGDQCDGWRLVNNPFLSVIHELMPPKTAEVRHYHERAAQFFFLLSGTATMEVNGELVELAPQEGIEIPAGMFHQIMNKSDQNIEFLVISQPSTTGDRIQTQ